MFNLTNKTFGTGNGEYYKFEVEEDPSNAEMKIEETKTALKEMGLDDNIG